MQMMLGSPDRFHGPRGAGNPADAIDADSCLPGPHCAGDPPDRIAGSLADAVDAGLAVAVLPLAVQLMLTMPSFRRQSG